MDRTPAPSVVAHAGLGIHHAGGAPDIDSLRAALTVGANAIEIDICSTSDGALVLHHDRKVGTGASVSTLMLDELQRIHPVLVLEECIEIVGEDVPLILDVKTDEAVRALARWWRFDDARPLAVCSERPSVLRALSIDAPGLPLWHTFPDIGTRRHERVLRLAGGFLAHGGTSALRLAGDVRSLPRRTAQSPRDALTHVTGLPWRSLLAGLIPAVNDQFQIKGISVHQSLVSRELCEVAHALDLTVGTWTVNTPTAARQLAALGVDLITTDCVEETRRALTGS